MGTEAAGEAASRRGEITLEGLRATFPAWRIFCGDGSWWAVRGGWQAWTGPESLLLRAMTAPDPAALAEKLCIQEWLGGLDGEALAAVWRGSLMEDPQ